MHSPPDQPCRSCRHLARAGRCLNRRCPEYQPCTPAVKDQALREMRAILAQQKEQNR